MVLAGLVLGGAAHVQCSCRRYLELHLECQSLIAMKEHVPVFVHIISILKKLPIQVVVSIGKAVIHVASGRSEQAVGNVHDDGEFL